MYLAETTGGQPTASSCDGLGGLKRLGPNDRPDGLITCKRIALLLGVSCTCVTSMVKDGRLPPPVAVRGQNHLWRLAEVAPHIPAERPKRRRRRMDATTAPRKAPARPAIRRRGQSDGPVWSFGDFGDVELHLVRTGGRFGHAAFEIRVDDVPVAEIRAQSEDEAKAQAAAVANALEVLCRSAGLPFDVQPAGVQPW
jgi:predicted DNA-binding transcriptional regulator AlpA